MTDLLVDALEGTTGAIEREDWDDAQLHARCNRELLSGLQGSSNDLQATEAEGIQASRRIAEAALDEA